MSDTSADLKPELSVVVPLFNEESNICEVHRRLTASLSKEGFDYEIVFVDDGSRDGTPGLLNDICERDPRVVALFLSRNFGHQPAVSAGIDDARGRAVIVMDGDLQDPPEVIPQFVALWKNGNDVVYAVRQQRKETWFKRLGYHTFYRLLNAISDLDIPIDSGDFGLMDRRVVEALKELPERKRFIRGLRTFVGFKQVGLNYERAGREAGSPKYTVRMLIGLAIDGLISFSSYPLRLVTYIGMFIAALSGLLMVWVVADALVQKTAPRGWASTVTVILFMGSLQLICLGIVGEYVRLIFIETKMRPTYIVARRLQIDAKPVAEST